MLQQERELPPSPAILTESQVNAIVADLSSLNVSGTVRVPLGGSVFFALVDEGPTTASLNAGNRRKLKPASSRFKGVVLQPSGRWSASAKRGTVVKYLGRFDVEEDAARAYDVAAVELFGEFAATNQRLGLL